MSAIVLGIGSFRSLAIARRARQATHWSLIPGANDSVAHDCVYDNENMSDPVDKRLFPTQFLAKKCLSVPKLGITQI